MSDWTGVRDRVLALAAHPDSLRLFGASGHRFLLEAPLTAADVADFEDWSGIELPEGYRSFLLRVGAGGAGPAYGIFPLRRDGSGGWCWIGGDAAEVDWPLLPDPFPGGDDPAAVAEILAEAPDQEDFDDRADLDAAVEMWEERLADLQYDPGFTPGALCLVDEGCGLSSWLVVTGEERGRIWRDRRADDLHLRPATGADGSPPGFTAW